MNEDAGRRLRGLAKAFQFISVDEIKPQGWSAEMMEAADRIDALEAELKQRQEDEFNDAVKWRDSGIDFDRLIEQRDELAAALRKIAEETGNGCGCGCDEIVKEITDIAQEALAKHEAAVREAGGKGTEL